MAYASFSQFLEALDQAGELQRITTPVETDLVIAEWADREMKSPGGGKALLFEQPLIDGEGLQVSRRHQHDGLGESEWRWRCRSRASRDLAQEIQLILKAKPPTDLREGWSLLKQGIHLLHARPKQVKSAACQEVVHRFDERFTNHEFTNSRFTLLDLPILQCWPKDGGRFITLPNVHTRDPETGARNLGMYRMQVYDEPDDRDALAGAQGRRAPRQALLRTQRTDAGRGHDRRRSGLHLSPRPRRCPMGSTKFFSPVSCARNRSNWSSA